MVVLVLDILFISLVGEAGETSQLDTLMQDERYGLKGIYDHLDVIGFRSAARILSEEGAAELDEEEQRRRVRENVAGKFLAMVVYFLLSIYLESHFAGEEATAKGEAAFGERHYARLFEWEPDKVERKKAA